MQNSRFLKIPSKIDPFGCLQLVIGMHRSHKMAPSEGFITFWCLRGYSILVSCQIQTQEWFILSWIPHRNCKIKSEEEKTRHFLGFIAHQIPILVVKCIKKVKIKCLKLQFEVLYVFVAQILPEIWLKNWKTFKSYLR